MAITETRALPPQFVEDLGRDYATQLTGLTSQPLDTTKFQPMVAGQDQAQKMLTQWQRLLVKVLELTHHT
jgi:hypothetical protein